MITDEIVRQVEMSLGHVPTKGQAEAVRTFAEFLSCRNAQSAMILRGSAGTGKTTLAAAIVKMLKRLGQKITLLAPTGRAAKVFSMNAGCVAHTIHRRIYREQTVGEMNGVFNLNANLQRDMLFIVDEASMVANEGYSETMFGSGRLLDDLVRYVYGCEGCRLMLIGDKAQLPPVGEEESPALSDTMIEGYGLDVFSADLDEILRQSVDSGILYNATVVRRMITHDDITQLPKIRFNGFADIKNVPGGELIEQLSNSYSNVGEDETIVITRSNKRANIFNQGIRAQVIGQEDELCGGDMVMIVRNNYYWSEREKLPVSFIANGDRARVRRVRNIHEMHGLRFADVLLTFPDYNDMELQATVCLSSLTTEAPALTREQQEALYRGVEEDYADITNKRERIARMKEDMYFNALQIKFAYAVTCHKAQGGQWADVYVDQGYMTDDMLTPDYIHWLYTAFTRATEHLYLVNWPKEQVEDYDKLT